MRHFVAVVVLIALVTAAVAFLLSPANILPTLASEEAPMWISSSLATHFSLLSSLL